MNIIQSVITSFKQIFLRKDEYTPVTEITQQVCAENKDHQATDIPEHERLQGGGFNPNWKNNCVVGKDRLPGFLKVSNTLIGTMKNPNQK